MPLSPYLEKHSFDPDALQAMTRAFDKACQQLQLKDRTDRLCELVARKIIEVAATGERDPDRLCAKVLSDLTGQTA